jgi:hypothetical protein
LKPVSADALRATLAQLMTAAGNDAAASRA